MKKRIAIQFFGHLRTFESTFESFKKYVLEPNQTDGYEIDIFMHTWDELEYTSWQWHNDRVPHLRGKKLTLPQVDFVKKYYNPVVFETTPQIQINDKTEFPEFAGGKTKYATMVNVWFTKYRVNQLRNEYEKKHNIKYDFVINTRADVLYNTPFNLTNILSIYDGLLKTFDTPNNKLFYSGHHRELSILDEKLLAASDILYFGTPDVMNKISSIYPTLNKKELAKKFMSWEYYQIYIAHKNNIQPIQLKYSNIENWEIRRFDGAVVSKNIKFKTIRKFLSMFIPSKKIRHIIRGK